MMQLTWILTSTFLLLSNVIAYPSTISQVNHTRILPTAPTPSPHILQPPKRSTHLARRTYSDDLSFEPIASITLHYAQPDWENSTVFHGGRIEWTMTKPTLVLNDHPEYVTTVKCAGDGTVLYFTNAEAYAIALNWSMPMYIITEGSVGLCAMDKTTYHPILLKSIQSNSANSFTITYSSQRSTWKSSAVHHSIYLGTQTASTVATPGASDSSTAAAAASDANSTVVQKRGMSESVLITTAASFNSSDGLRAKNTNQLVGDAETASYTAMMNAQQNSTLNKRSSAFVSLDTDSDSEVLADQLRMNPAMTADTIQSNPIYSTDDHLVDNARFQLVKRWSFGSFFSSIADSVTSAYESVAEVFIDTYDNAADLARQASQAVQDAAMQILQQSEDAARQAAQQAERLAQRVALETELYARMVEAETARLAAEAVELAQYLAQEAVELQQRATQALLEAADAAAAQAQKLAAEAAASAAEAARLVQEAINEAERLAAEAAQVAADTANTLAQRLAEEADRLAREADAALIATQAAVELAAVTLAQTAVDVANAIANAIAAAELEAVKVSDAATAAVLAEATLLSQQIEANARFIADEAVKLEAKATQDIIDAAQKVEADTAQTALQAANLVITAERAAEQAVSDSAIASAAAAVSAAKGAAAIADTVAQEAIHFAEVAQQDFINAGNAIPVAAIAVADTASGAAEAIADGTVALANQIVAGVDDVSLQFAHGVVYVANAAAEGIVAAANVIGQITLAVVNAILSIFGNGIPHMHIQAGINYNPKTGHAVLPIPLYENDYSPTLDDFIVNKKAVTEYSIEIICQNCWVEISTNVEIETGALYLDIVLQLILFEIQTVAQALDLATKIAIGFFGGAAENDDAANINIPDLAGEDAVANTEAIAAEVEAVVAAVTVKVKPKTTKVAGNSTTTAAAKNSTVVTNTNTATVKPAAVPVAAAAAGARSRRRTVTLEKRAIDNATAEAHLAIDAACDAGWTRYSSKLQADVTFAAAYRTFREGHHWLLGNLTAPSSDLVKRFSANDFGNLIGSVAHTLFPHKAFIKVDLDMTTNIDLLILFSGTYIHEFKHALGQFNPVGFLIPDVVNIGPVASLYAVGEFALKGDLELGIGLDFQWTNVSAEIHLNNLGDANVAIPPPKFNFHPIQPRVESLSLQAGFFIEPELLFEIAVYAVDEKVSAGIGARVGAINAFSLGADECDTGIQYDLNIDLELQGLYTTGTSGEEVVNALWDAPTLDLLNICIDLSNRICPVGKTFSGHALGCVYPCPEGEERVGGDCMSIE